MPLRHLINAIAIVTATEEAKIIQVTSTPPFLLPSPPRFCFFECVFFQCLSETLKRLSGWGGGRYVWFLLVWWWFWALLGIVFSMSLGGKYAMECGAWADRASRLIDFRFSCFGSSLLVPPTKAVCLIYYPQELKNILLCLDSELALEGFFFYSFKLEDFRIFQHSFLPTLLKKKLRNGACVSRNEK